MWTPYLDVIRDKCSHVVAKINRALDEVRAAESRKMAQDGHEPLRTSSSSGNTTPQLGRQVPGLPALADYAVPRRTNERHRPNATPSPYAAVELFGSAQEFECLAESAVLADGVMKLA